MSAGALEFREVGRLRRLTAAAALLLVAATWRLWTPGGDFPRVPLVGPFAVAPAWLDWLALSGLLTAAAGLFWRRRPRADSNPRPTFAVGLFVGSLGLLVLLDQHRGQVWAGQFALILIVTSLAQSVRAAALLRLLTVGVYFWSAVSKCDFSFLHGLGPVLLGGLCDAVGLSAPSPAAAARLTPLFPLGELLVAGLLAAPRTRPCGLAAAAVLHGLLLLTLGPLGLRHEPGVLLWNLFFFTQDALLFWPTAGGGVRPRRVTNVGKRIDPRNTAGTNPAARCTGEYVATALVTAAVTLPILEPFGLLDPWPAWAVYTSNLERVTLRIDADAAEALPEDVRRHLGPPDPFGRRPLRIDRWSLDALGVPVSPQARFRVAVARAVVERFELNGKATLVVEGRAGRFDGRRTRTTYRGAAEIDRYAESAFLLNTRTR